MFAVRRRRRGAQEHAAHARRPSIRYRREHPDARFVIAGGASLLDHSAYQSEFRATLATLGARASAVVCHRPARRCRTCPRSIGSPRRSSLPQSRKVLASACSRRWRAERPSSSRASRPSSNYLGAAGCAVLRSATIRRRSLRRCGWRCCPTRQSAFARAGFALAARHSLARGRRAQPGRLPRPCGSRPCLRCASSIRWPDGRRESCYSPSLVVRDYFREGESYPLADFLLARAHGAARSPPSASRRNTAMPVRWRSANSRASKRAPRRSRKRPDAKVVCETFSDGGLT